MDPLTSNVVEEMRNEIDKEDIRKDIIVEEVASFLKNQAEAVLVEEKMGMGVSAVFRHDKDQISEAKPDTIFSGAKQKAITLTEEVADKPSLSSAPVKNVTEWSCALCQVCTTNQDGLNDHFQGKKHKLKQAAFREQKDEKNCRIGLLPKKPRLIQLVQRPCDDLISGKKSEEGSLSPNDNDPPSLLTDDSAVDFTKNAAHEKQNNREFTFWCDTCKIGTFSEKVMETYKIGKKHKCKEDAKNCSIGLSPNKPRFIQLVQCPWNDLISGKKSEEGSSSTNDNDPPSLLIDDSADDLRKNTAHEKQNNREFKFWCDT